MHSLRRQLTLGSIGAFGLILAAGGIFVYCLVRSALHQQFDESLRIKVLTVVTATLQDRGEIEVNFSDKFLRDFDSEVATAFFQVWTAGGESIERSDSLGLDDLPRMQGSLEQPAYANLILPNGQPGRAVGLVFTPRGEGNRRGAPATATVVVAADRSNLDRTLSGLIWALVAGGSAMLIATGLVVPLVVGPRLTPLQRVADQASSIEAVSLQQRFPVDAMPVEVRPICERLNALLERLEHSFARERRFSSDLAHELLTPLAELRVLTESALKWPETSGPQTHRQTLDVLLRMESLATHLLDLTRAENGRLVVAAAPFDLSRLIAETWRPFADTAASRGLQVAFEGPEKTEVVGDSELVRAVARNLFNNAADHAPANGAVRIAWESNGRGFALQVTNPAPQITEGDLVPMFDRFWRKDASRTGTHSGLGLSLARQIAQALGGTLEPRLASGELTLRFTAPSPRSG